MLMIGKISKLFLTVLFTIFIIIIGVTIFIGTTFIILTRNSNVYNSKEEVEQNFQRNIEELSNFVCDLYSDYGNQYKYIIIEKNQDELFVNNFIDRMLYNNTLAYELFDNLKLDGVACNFEKNRYSFVIMENYSIGRVEVYYDINKTNSYYYLNDITIERDIMIEMNKWKAYISKDNPYFGWYTEEFYDNWFYSEEYTEGFGAIKYIEKDLKEIGKYDVIIEEIEKIKNEWRAKHFKKKE